MDFSADFHNNTDNRNRGNNPLANFIRKNFMGANITVTFVYGGTLSGEVIDGFDSVIGLKVGATKYFVNAQYIVSFV